MNNMNSVTTNTLWPMGRAQRRAGKTRVKLLDAALTVFSEVGVDAASIEQITEKADVGKGTFYRHFADKQQLLQSLIEEIIERLIDRVGDASLDCVNLEQFLGRLFDAHVIFFSEHTRQYVILFQGRMLIKLGRDLTGSIEGPYLRYLTTLEQKAAPFLPADFQAEKIRSLSCAIAGFVFGFFSFAMLGLSQQQIQDSLKSLRNAFVDSMARFLA